MKKLFKILGILFVIFIGLIITALILVKVFLPPEKVRALIVNKMGESLKREVEIQDLSVSIFKGVSVEGFKISESPTFQEGTFVSSKSFLVRYSLLSLLKKQLAISRVTLEEPFINITRNSDGSFNFSDLIQTAPVEQEKEALPEEEGKTEKAPALALLVSSAQLKDGQVNFTDHSPEAMSARAHKINLDVSDISLVSPMDISFSASIDHKDLSGDLSFDGKLDLNKGILEIERLSPAYADISVDITGVVEDFKDTPKLDISIQDKKVSVASIANIVPLPEGLKLTGSPHFKIDVSGSIDDLLLKTDINIDDVSVRFRDAFEKGKGERCGLKLDAELKSQDALHLKASSFYLGDLIISASGEIKGLKTLPPSIDINIHTNESNLQGLAKLSPIARNFNLSGKLGIACDVEGVPPKKLNFAGELNLKDANLLYDKHELKSVNIQGLKFSDTELSIPELKGLWNGSEFSFLCNVDEFTMERFTSPRVSFDFRLSSLEIDKILAILPPPAEEEDEEEKEDPSSTKPSPSPVVEEIIKGINLDGALQIDQILYNNLKLSNATAKIAMHQGKLEIKPFSIEGYEGIVSSELGADLNLINDVKFASNINLEGLDFNPAVMDLHPQRIAKIHGRAFFESSISGQSAKMPDSLAGEGFFMIENGKIDSGMPLLENLMAFLGKPQPEAIIFSELKGHYTLKDKRISTDDFQMIGDDLSFDAQGWTDLDMNLDFNVTASLNQKFLGEKISKHIVKDEQGRPMLFLVIKGKVNKPVIRPDLEKTLAEQGKQKAKDVILDKVLGDENKGLKEEIKKGLEKLFRFK